MDNYILFHLIGIAILLGCSAFFSSSETGLTAASRGKIHKLKMNGSKKAILVTRLRKNKDALIGTILLGNNAVNILASALATSLAIHIYGDAGIIYSTVIMTTLVLVFAEVLPKTYAFYNAEKISLNVAHILFILVRILSPVTNMVQLMVDFLMKLLGISKKSSVTLSGAEELRGTIELHHSEGRVVKGERDMLGSILDLTQTEISQVMTHRKKMISVDIDQTPSRLISQILSKAHTRIPVWKDRQDNIIGILHTKSLLQLMHKSKVKIKTKDIMGLLSEPWFVPETNNLNNQLLQFRSKRTHMAIVVDEYGDLVGLVTLEDILEEIVGQIDDEYDISSALKIRKRKGGSVEVDGEISIRDLNRQMDWSLPDDSATTIAGLIIHESETIPDIGQEFIFYGFTFKVLQRKDNQITKVSVKKSGKKTLGSVSRA